MAFFFYFHLIIADDDTFIKLHIKSAYQWNPCFSSPAPNLLRVIQTVVTKSEKDMVHTAVKHKYGDCYLLGRETMQSHRRLLTLHKNLQTSS
jgi:hypothetical protein